MEVGVTGIVRPEQSLSARALSALTLTSLRTRVSVKLTPPTFPRLAFTVGNNEAFLKVWGIICTAFFVLSSETARLLGPQSSAWSSFFAAHLLRSSLETAAPRRVSPGGPEGLTRAQRAAAPPPTSEDHAARQVPAQRGVAGLLAGPAPRAQTSLDRAHASEPWPVSHVRARARAAPAQPNVTTARRTCVLRPAVRHWPALPARHASTGSLPSGLSAVPEPSPPLRTCCGRGYTMERLDKAALNALQPPDFR